MLTDSQIVESNLFCSVIIVDEKNSQNIISLYTSWTSVFNEATSWEILFPSCREKYFLKRNLIKYICPWRDKLIMLWTLKREVKCFYQEQQSRGVHIKRFSKNMQQIYRMTSLPTCDFNKVAKQIYWNHTVAWVFFCKLAAYFQNTFS